MVRERERLARLEPGGAPDRPIALVSASLVEVRARSMPCPICGSEVRVADHTAETLEGQALRLAHTRCPSCGYEGIVYFALRAPVVN
jgi:ribosomal protein S27AE